MAQKLTGMKNIPVKLRLNLRKGMSVVEASYRQPYGQPPGNRILQEIETDFI
jgi:hypothetical protein